MARYRRRHERHLPRTWLSLFVRLGGWLAIIGGALLVIVTLFSAGSLYLADKFDREGALAYAIVTGKRGTESTDAEGNVRRQYYVEFTFKVRGSTGPSGRTAEAEVTPGYYNGVLEQDERPIRYLVADPSVVEEDIGRYRRTGTLLRWAGLIVGLAGLAALWIFGARANRAVIVRRDGEKRYARVTAIRELKISVAGARQGRLVWREEDGQVGESLMRRAQWLRERYGPGDSIVVFRKGRHVYWEGDVGPPRREIAGRPPAT